MSVKEKNSVKNIVTYMSDSRRGFGFDIEFSDHLQIVTTSNCNSLTELHTPNITVTAAHFIRRILVTDFNSADSSASVLTAPTKSSRHRLPYNSLPSFN
jgi:hypothetical protein